MGKDVKIRKLILYGPKGLRLGIWASDLGKQMSDLKSAPLRQGTKKILMRLES